MPHLVIRLDIDRYFHAPVAGARTNLGRGGWAEDVHVSVAHPSVAELHVSIEAIEGGFQLVDRSGGRTLVRERPVSEITLVDGMRFLMGEVQATFHEEAAPAEPATIADRDEPPLPERLWLVVKRPGSREPPRRVPVGDELTLGSARDRDVRLAHPTVSAHHATIEREEKRLRLRDESRNGTLVNQVPIEASALPLGAVVSIGPYELRVTGEEEDRRGLEEFHGLYTSHPAVKALFPLIARIAAEECPVLVRGETGTGKEGVARALHALSRHAGGPFEDVNCGAIPENLIESELFGSKAGAFTGALARDGIFVRADGGTLFLDEIGELSPAMQPKLLRVLQEGVVRPLGAAEPVRVRVRVVAATHRDLGREVEAGRFRADLFYRLVVAQITLPPLRERGDDAVLLFSHLLSRARPSSALPAVTEAVKARLRAHPWPGNVRELKNVAERAWLQVGMGRTLGPEHLIFDAVTTPEPPKEARDTVDPKGLTLEEIERAAIAIVLRQNGGNRRGTAKQLGINHKTLLRKLRVYGLGGDDEGESFPPDGPGERPVASPRAGTEGTEGR